MVYGSFLFTSISTFPLESVKYTGGFESMITAASSSGESSSAFVTENLAVVVGQHFFSFLNSRKN